ncbi:Cellulose synthase [Artemisia annua]|uniref:Cellulose synthase n=1 Tax=Artemisia annua TaxID=35608 RepID=A0A2U1L3Z2_ARTAN|nr:Cellulose synthase [Artemisia annua]
MGDTAYFVIDKCFAYGCLRRMGLYGFGNAVWLREGCICGGEDEAPPSVNNRMNRPLSRKVGISAAILSRYRARQDTIGVEGYSGIFKSDLPAMIAYISFTNAGYGPSQHPTQVTDCSPASDSWFISNIEDLTSQHVCDLALDNVCEVCFAFSWLMAHGSWTCRSTDITVNKRKGLSDLPGIDILIKLHQDQVIF